MKKIPSLFKRNYETDRLVRDEVVDGCEWVLAGEGIATRKFDGTACMVKNGELYKRYDVKAGRTKPDGFIQSQDPDKVTGHWPGWIPVGDGPEDTHHRDGFVRTIRLEGYLPDGTYELVGPKIQGNPEKFDGHFLVRHGVTELSDCPRTFAEIRDYLKNKNIEGVVWWNPDGRMCKIKKKDFGFKR